MKCYACGKLVSTDTSCGRKQDLLTIVQGHISRDCTAPNGGPLNAAGKVCYKCGQAGHISRDCTTADVNGGQLMDTSDPMAGVPTPAVNATVA